MQKFLATNERPQAQPPSEPPRELPPDPEPAATSLGLAQGSVDVVDERAYLEELKRAEEELDLLKLSPAERYRKTLEREGIPLDEARKIIDTVVVQTKRWEERVFLTKNFSVVFQTRTPEDIDRLNLLYEKEMPHYEQTMLKHMRTHNIAASLVRYGDKKFPRETDEDFIEILKWVDKLPQPTWALLSRKLEKFDWKVNFVFADGYIENF